MSEYRQHNDLLRFAYPDSEVARIKKIEEGNETLEEKLEVKRSDWNDKINPLFLDLKKNFKLESVIIELQANALMYKQMIIEEISVFLNQRTKLEVTLRQLKTRETCIIFNSIYNKIECQ